MREPLVVAVAQPPCAPYDVAANAMAHAAAIRAAGARVVVFPEMSLTGYELNALPVEPDDPRLTPVVEACAETGALALAGAPVRGEADRSHIALLAVEGTGATVAYRKMWLGSEEAGHFAPGDAPAVLDVDGWRLGLAVCKDTGVLRHSDDTAALGIDAYVAGVLDHQEEEHIHDERAHRIATAHGVWVALASFAGPTGHGYTRSAGRSGVWSPQGTNVVRAGREPGALVRAVLA